MWLTICLFAQLVIAFSVIPPWQNPDEPQHLMTSRLVMAHGPDFVLGRDTDAASERAIVQSMAAYGWWRHYGRATPDPVPESFAAGPAKVVEDYFGPPGGGSRLYYRAMAASFRAAGIEGLLTQLYAMRALSALAALVTLACIWAGSRDLLGERSAVVITALVALHPQFVFVSTTASPDALVNLAGALVWRASAGMLAGGVAVADVFVLWAAAVVGFALRRMGAPLLVAAALVTAYVFWREMRRVERRRSTATIGLLLVMAAGVGLWILIPDLSRAVDWVRFDPVRSMSTIVSRASSLPAFFEMFFTTFWLSAGWLRYPGPSWWQLIAATVTAIAASGLVFLLIARRQNHALGLSALVVSLQVTAVVAYYFGIVQAGPQGRYVFPVLPAILCLIWLGWSSVIGRAQRPQLAAASLVLVMAALNTSAWVLVVLPAYL